MSEEKSFRIQNTMLHLTYKSHLNPEKFLLWLKKEKDLVPIYYSIANETGDTGYEHSHVLLKFKHPVSTRNVSYFDYLKIHPNIKPIRYKKHWEETVTYHKKQISPFTNIEVRETKKDIENEEHDEDEEYPDIPDIPNIPGPRRTSTVEDVWKHPHVSDALLYVCQSLQEVGGVIAAFNHKPMSFGEEPLVLWKGWQKELYQELSSQSPDPRKIIWYEDEIGNSGKTFFAKHMGMYKGAFVSTHADIYHVATSLQEAFSVGRTCLCAIFNFARDDQRLKDVYRALESIKDGMVTSRKYKGKTMYFEVPHVVVFANYGPDWSKMSQDRWDLRVITPSGAVLRRFSSDPKNIFKITGV